MRPSILEIEKTPHPRHDMIDTGIARFAIYPSGTLLVNMDSQNLVFDYHSFLILLIINQKVFPARKLPTRSSLVLIRAINLPMEVINPSIEAIINRLARPAVPAEPAQSLSRSRCAENQDPEILVVTNKKIHRIQ